MSASAMAVGVLITCTTFAPLITGQREKGMQDDTARLMQLILDGRKDQASPLARSLGPRAGEVLLEASTHPKASVRMLALELAAANPSPASCRAILGRLSDSNATVRSVAGNLLGQCRDRGNVPDLLAALDHLKEPSVRIGLIAQLGVAGGPEQIPLLQRLRSEPDVARAAALALAQLGDLDERQKLIQRLSDPDAEVRLNALRDCITVRDPKLAAWFGPALEDLRDVLPITGPHDGPAVYARVADFAVLAMAQLGYRFSFPVEFLERRPREQLREATQRVDALPRAQDHLNG